MVVVVDGMMLMLMLLLAAVFWARWWVGPSWSVVSVGSWDWAEG